MRVVFFCGFFLSTLQVHIQWNQISLNYFLFHKGNNRICYFFVSTEIVRAMTYVINQGMSMYWGTSRWTAMEIMGSNIFLNSICNDKIQRHPRRHSISIYFKCITYMTWQYYWSLTFYRSELRSKLCLQRQQSTLLYLSSSIVYTSHIFSPLTEVSVLQYFMLL